jgi:hypothetical protein
MRAVRKSAKKPTVWLGTVPYVNGYTALSDGHGTRQGGSVDGMAVCTAQKQPLNHIHGIAQFESQGTLLQS